ncbi:phosphomethylpyrimidine synthase ThiC, partial [Candidatus Sumerlaeota bacterium]|nr:phosphomethylpyrimidine synthase ThiC [Candidatus Sumerlaeota bacterium]
MTQLVSARNGVITPEMKAVAESEKIPLEILREGIAQGLIVIPRNKNHDQCRPTGIGKGLRTKVNANIGTSSEHCHLEEEIRKLEASIEAGTDTVMDLSTGGNLDHIRKILIQRSPVPLGTVPIYQCVVEILGKGKQIPELDESLILDTVRRHAESGVDFITIHSGLTMGAVQKMRKRRIMDVVSRG